MGVTAAGSFLLGLRAPSSAQETVSIEGAEIYALTCAVCHGPRGEGREGDGVEAGPPVVGLDVMFVDQFVRTGRMPIAEPSLGVVRDQLTDAEREALLEFMIERMDLEGEVPEVAEGDRARGHELYGLHCTACHGATGQGGVGAAGSVIPGVTGLDRVAVYEAIRVGPYDMPAFSEDMISHDDAAAIATFVEADLSEPPATAIGLAEMHRVTFWAFAWVVALALLVVVLILARPVRAERREAEAAP